MLTKLAALKGKSNKKNKQNDTIRNETKEMVKVSFQVFKRQFSKHKFLYITQKVKWVAMKT